MSATKETRVVRGWHTDLLQSGIPCEEADASEISLAIARDVAPGGLRVSDRFSKTFSAVPFRIAISTEWRIPDVINSLEMDAVLLPVLHMCRSASVTS